MEASRPKTVAHTGNTHIKRRTSSNSQQEAASESSDSITLATLSLIQH